MTAVHAERTPGTGNITRADHSVLEANSGPHIPFWLLIVLICLYLPSSLFLLGVPWHSKA
jgi:hypothetical protein